ncbi:MAG TPA: ATP-binding protein [Bryobacteraceae bacterium]|nr:ATP-binding protein [Bryobacteraceae bacterium]
MDGKLTDSPAPGSTAISSPSTSLFDGGGQMGELMRTIDWSRTPVGPVENWPQSLKTALSVLLKQRTAVFLFWGPEHVQFYNDAYRPILGAKKHPAAMGQRGAECWPEIWDIILPMLEAVHRGESTAVEDGLLVIDRDGYLEEGYYTYTYSPIAEESGTVGGVFCVVYDTTAHVIGERRLRTLRDLASRTITKDATEACRLAAATLAENPWDVPFAAVYLYDPNRKSATLAGVAGVKAGSAAAPVKMSFEGELSPVAAIASLGRVAEIPDLARHTGPLPAGPWPVEPASGIIVPIMAPGHALPTGFMLAGVNPRKRLDPDYRTFFELIAGQIATAVAEARAYEEERKRAEALAELDRVKTAFFSNVSHEFRTPLTLMLGPLTDVLSGPDASLERSRGELTIAHRNCLRLLKLVNSLLDFSRIEAGRIQARYEPVDLSTLTSDLCSVFRSAMERAGLQFTVDCPPLPQPVYVDREMWEKIVLNLLSNAFKFTFEGEIRVSLAAAGGHARLDVSDTGTGIPERELARVFERFHRIDGGRARSQEGSGIGLALVQELARLHGATVQVQSEFGKGSTFSVLIPFGAGHLPQEHIGTGASQASTAIGAQTFLDEALRWLPDAPAPATIADLVPSAQQPAAEKRARILVADDNSDMREYLRRLLGEQYEVQAVADGATALAAMREHRPDLLLADVMMPGLDGFRLLKAIRQDAELSSLPVVLLSARAGEESRLEGLLAGADDYVVKPFSARELLVRISSRLEIARLREASAEAEHRLLAEAEAERRKLRDVIEQAPAMVAVLSGPEHVFQIVNGEYARATGRSEAELTGKLLREALPEITNQGFLELLDSVYRTGEPVFRSEALARLRRRPDGPLEDRFFNFVYQPWKDVAGRIQGVFVHAVDITEQVIARQRLEQSEQALRALVEKERDARSTAELLNRVGPTLLSQLDFQALVQSLNEIATQLTGAQGGGFFRNDLSAGDGASVATVFGDAGEALRQAWDEHAAAILSCRSGERSCFRYDHPARAPALRSLLGCPVVSRSGEMLGALLFGHAEPARFTEAHEAIVSGIAAQAAIALDNARLFEQAQWIQTELKRSNEELRRANRDLEVFAYSASHDLQEPLRTIAISAELIARSLGPQLSGDQRMFLDNILTGARRMIALIQDLLAYTRATKAEEGPPSAIDSGKVLAGVVESMQPAIDSANAAIVAGDLPPVPIHERPLAQLFQNLISNALKYRGAGPPRIEISAQERDGWCVFSVSDNGIGIEERFREQVFGLFKRLHSREKYPGSGVGLAICQRLIEQYGGRIWIEHSEVGKGTTFCFAVPVARPRLAIAEKHETAKPHL